MRIKLLFIILIFLNSAFSVDAGSFKAGAAVRIITPEKLLPISGGMGAPVIPEGIQGDLFVRVLVLEKDSMRVAIVSIDNLGWPMVLGNMSRALIPSVPPENILIGVTHTHSAPDAYGFPDEEGNVGMDTAYIRKCVKMIAEAVHEAFGRLEPAVLQSAVAEAKGKLAYNFYAPQLYDPRVGVLKFTSASGKNKGSTIATLVNYAIHPEILGTKSKLISADLCGPFYERLESQAGGIAIFMNSALGGMVTADNRREDGTEANDWDECIRIGHLMADEALRIVEEAPSEEDPELYCASKSIEIPVDSEAMKMVLNSSPILKQSDYDRDNQKITTRLNLLNIGDAGVLTIPGEALPNIGFYLKRNMKTQKPFLFGLTNDAFGYIMVKEDFNSFERYDYISRTSLGEMTGDIFISEAIQMIKEHPAPGK